MEKLFFKGLLVLLVFVIQSGHGQILNLTIKVITSPSCYGGGGELEADVVGGTSPYSYKWYDVSVGENVIGTSAVLTNVNESAYCVIATDADGSVYASDTIALNNRVASVYASAAHCPQADGTATIEYSGNFASPVSVLWSNGSTDATVTGLSAGTKLTVQVLDANGCPFSFNDYVNQRLVQKTSKTIEIGSIPSFTIDHQYLPATCTRPDGYVTINVTGTTAPYNYVWNTSPVLIGSEQSNLTTGNYTVRVSDSEGCFGDYSFYLPNTPGSLSGDVYVSQKEYCLRQDGKISLYYSGGTSPYTVQWSTGETDVTSLSGLSAGYYSVTVKDAENCEIKKSVVVDRYSPVTAQFTHTEADCNNENGAITSQLTGGTLPYTYRWNNGAITQNISGLGIGWYDLLATDAEGCTAYEHTYLPTQFGCQGNITGVIYQDNNNNCVKDADEPLIVNHAISGTNVTTSYGMYGMTDYAGFYLLRYPYNGTYKMNTYLASPYYSTECPLNGQTISTAAPGNYSYDIGLVPIAIGADLQTSIFSTWVRPGFLHRYDVYVRNVGTASLASGTVQIQLGDIETLVDFSDFPASYDPTLHELVFDISDLNLNDVRHFSFNCSIEPTVLLNTKYNVTATAYPLVDDLNEASNSYTLKQTVVGSYDPNDIQSFKEGDLNLGEDTTITYQIRFQNTGNFYAEFILVRDTLDAKLDPSTLRDIQASHPVKVTLLENNVVEFAFDNIFLADSSSNQEESHGFITYKINLKKSITAGDQVLNRAAIFFDYNAPVLTNQVSNRIAIPSGILNQSDNKHTAVVFPNPAHGQATFVFQTSIETFELLNAFGQPVYHVNANRNTLQINTSGWKGMHYYKATDGEGVVYTGKIIIE